MVKSISGCLTIGEGTYVALFCILHYTHLSGVCFSLKYCCVQPKPKAMSLSQASLYTPTPLLLLVLDLLMYQTRPDPLNNWFEPILPLTLVRELDREWLNLVSPCL